MSRLFKTVKLRFSIILLCGTVLYFFANIQRVAFPGAVFDRLQQIYGCEAAGITGLGASFMFAYALMQPLTGLLLDRYGGSRVFCCGGLIFGIGEFLFARASTLPAAYIAQVLAGIGAGSLYLFLVRENMRIFPKKYNMILAAIILCGYSGSVVANAPLLYLIDHFGFRNTLTVNASITVLAWLAAIFLILPGRLPNVRKEHTFSLKEFFPVLRIPHNLKLYIFSALNFGLYYVIQTVIGKKFLQDYCAMKDLDAGWIFSVTGALAAAGGFSFAFLSHFTGERRQIFCRIAGCSSITVFGSIVILILCGIKNGVVFTALFLLLSSTASLSTILIPLLRETNQEQMVGKAVSMLNFTFYLAVAGLGNLTGLLLNCFSPVVQNGLRIYGSNAWLTVFIVLFCFSCPVFYFSFRMRETFGKKIII